MGRRYCVFRVIADDDTDMDYMVNWSVSFCMEFRRDERQVLMLWIIP